MRGIIFKGLGFCAWALVAAPVFPGGRLWAQPTGGQVVAGAATFSATAGALTITQTSGRAIINWQDFSSGTGTLTKFVQPDATSAVLNRVVSARPSTLDGALQANGRVYLINPNGVLIGGGARIDTGGFLASTLDVADREFLADGDLRFTGGSKAAIENLGAINALGGDVFLIARQIENAGVISAANGTAGLAAGSEVLLTTGGSERLFVQAASNAGAVVNTGTIDAASAELKAAGGNAYALAINNAGAVRATGVGRRDGAIWLLAGGGDVASTGTLDASSAEGRGGQVEVRGDRVTLGRDSRIDASGATGGGRIGVFGGSLEGGRVTVDGVLVARARVSGDGGFIETSAARVKVANSARVTTTSATAGANGTWLIDPVDFTIAASGGDMTGSAVGTALAGGNFTIQSSTGGSGTAGDVNVNDTVSWSVNTLTLNAQNNINFNSALHGSGTASLALEYGQGAIEAGNTSTYQVRAAIDLPTGNHFSTKLGSDGAVTNFTVINSLGAEGDAAAAPATATVQGMAAAANLDGHFVLGSNIDASPTANWGLGAGFTPIGDTNVYFTGVFDGLGHVICDLTINQSGANDIGMFGVTYFGSAIRNVGLSCVDVTGGGSVGALVGYKFGGTITNSWAAGEVTGSGSIVGGLVGNNAGGSILGSYTTVTLNGDGAVGGLVGDVSGGSVDGSYATGSVSGTGGSVGGLVGKIDSGTLSNSYATGSVVGASQVGGLVGVNSGAVIGGYATGGVNGTGSALGGLAGDNFGTIDNSYSTGIVNGGTDSVGGLVGYNGGAINNTYATGTVISNGDFVGGLVGDNVGDAGTVGNSYSTGVVTSGGSFVGGSIGYNGGPLAALTNVYWNTDATASGIGGGETGGATGLTALEMRTATNFAGFNFTTTPGAAGNNWVIVDANGSLNNAGATAGATTPMLASEYSTTIQSGHQLQLVQMATAASYTLGTNVAAASTGHRTDVWGAAGFVPLGVFTGTFDGRGHVINDLTMNWPTTDAVGLFGSTQGASIRNLGLVNPVVTGQQQVGALIGLSTGTAISTSLVIGGTVTGTTDVGGMVGQAYYFGVHPPRPTYITDSYTSDVAVTGTTNVGGLVGYNRTGIVNNSYSSSTVAGTTDVGELIGNNTSTITDSFWNKTVKAVGIGSDVSIGDTAGATGVTAAELQQQLNFTSSTTANGSTNPAWDFASNWVMYEGHTAPLLRVFMTPLTVTANSVSRTYNGLAYSGGDGVSYFCCPDMTLLFGSVAYGGTSQGAINVGTYGITPSGLYSTQLGYLITNAPGTLTVTKAILTLSGTRVFDGTTLFAGSHLTATGVHGETFSLTGAGDASNLAGKNVSAGEGLSSVTGLSLGGSSNGGLAGNYNALQIENSSVSVTAAPLTVSSLDVVKTYDGGTTANGTAVITAGTLFGSDVLAFSSFGPNFVFVGKDVGLGNKTVTVSGIGVNDGNAGHNYVVTLVDNTTSTINRADLTLSGTRVYDGTTIFAGSLLTATGVNGETFSVTGAGAVGNLTTKNVQTSQLLGSVTGMAVGTGNTGAALASNYKALATTGSTVTVTPASLTITADNKNKVYGAPDPTLTATFSGLVPSDDTSVVNGLVLSTTTGALATAGTHTIFASGATASNYTISFGNGLLTVTPATLLVTADVQTKIYGNADPALTFAAGPLQYTDTVAGVLSGGLTRVAGETVAGGPYQIGVGSLAANANYTISYTGNALTITPRPITLAPGTTTKVYGAVDPALSVSITGGSLGSITVSDTLAEVTGTLGRQAGQDVGLYDVQLGTGTKVANYAITFVTDNNAFAITPATLTYVATATSRLIGEPDPAFTGTVTGFIPGETLANATTGTLAFNTTATSASPVGVYPINGSGLIANHGNYVFVQAPPNATAFTIGAAPPSPPLDPLTITADDKTKLYGAALPAFTATFAGFVNGDTASSVTGLQFNTTATIGSNVGTYAITPFGATAPGNYSINYVAGTLTINPATLTYTATLVTRLVGENNPVFTGTVGGFVNGDTQAGATTGTLAFGSTATNASPAGTYAINGSGLTANGGNYVFVQAPPNATALTINPVPPPALTPLTITADDKSKLYGAPLPAFTASYAGFINSDTASSVTGLQFSTTATIGSNVGTYVITPFGATAPGYYTVSYIPGTLTINPATLTYTATPVSRLFGVENPTLTGAVGGFVNGDTATTATTGTATWGTTATTASAAGVYAINGSGLTANHGNYVFVQAPGNATAFTIAPVTPLTIKADDKSKLYGDALPTFTATFTGFTGSDTASSVTGLQFSTTATIGSNVGLYTIMPFGATAPSTYLVSYLPGTLAINPAALTIAANNATKIYGAANPAFSATFSGFKGADTATSLGGTLAFATPATTGSNVGSYAITASGLTSANYTLTYAPGTLTISRASLTIAANDATKVFGDANPAFSATFTGLVNGDASSVVTGLVFGTSATTDSAIGNYAIIPSGAAAANYVVTFVNGTLHVTVPSIPVNDTPTPVITIDDQPVLSGDYAVVVVGDRFVLVSLNRGNASETAVNDRLEQTLGELGGVLKNASGAGGGDFGTFLTHLNLSGFEVLATLGDGGDGADGLTPDQRAAPGTTRESALNRGKFNVVYRELLAEARAIAGDNLAARSSYNVFLDTDKPQVVIVHATNGKSRGPSDTPDGKTPANPSLTSLSAGVAKPRFRG